MVGIPFSAKTGASEPKLAPNISFLGKSVSIFFKNSEFELQRKDGYDLLTSNFMRDLKIILII